MVQGKKLDLEKIGWARPRFDGVSMALSLVGLVVMCASAWWAGQRPDFRAQYPLYDPSLPYYLGYLAYYIAWESLFRGYLQIGQSVSRFFSQATFWQVFLSTVFHWGKPWPEFFGAIPGGIFFGYLAFRTRSILPPLVLHVVLGFLNDYFCLR